MKVAVLNYSGNVGKTTISRHLLLPRIPAGRLITVESINADESQTDALKGKDFAQLQEFLLSNDSAVVDVGASNVEDLLVLMRRFRGSHADFDYFVVPTVVARKQQADTVATLSALSQMDIPHDKLRVVFNSVDEGDNIARTFAAVLLFAQSQQLSHVTPACVIGANEIFERLKGSEDTISALANDPTDLKALIAQASSPAEKSALAHKLATRRLAIGVLPELDACFEALRLT